MPLADNEIRAARILIADDDADLRQVLQLALEPLGVVLTLAQSGDEALYYLRRQRFDIVVCDQKMPGADGIEVLLFAREIKPNPSTFYYHHRRWQQLSSRSRPCRLAPMTLSASPSPWQSSRIELQRP